LYRQGLRPVQIWIWVADIRAPGFADMPDADGRYNYPSVPATVDQRQVRQQRADIDSLYELVEQKVDALDGKLDRRFDEVSSQLSEVLRQLGGR
jgi:hypothetical protein